jgi:hypothetical protein
MDDNGRLFVAEYTHHRLQIFCPEGKVESFDLEVSGQIRGLARYPMTNSTYIC